MLLLFLEDRTEIIISDVGTRGVDVVTIRGPFTPHVFSYSKSSDMACEMSFVDLR